MDKKIKRALRTGVDDNNDALRYFCPQCGWTISLMHKKCPKCGAKRPKDAYTRAMSARAAAEQSANKAPKIYVDRSAGKIPAPKAPCYAAAGVDDLVRSCYATDAMAQLGIPKYYQSDEYGRIYETPVCYKPLTNGPVPVPKPSGPVQTEAITVPLGITQK